MRAHLSRVQEHLTRSYRKTRVNGNMAQDSHKMPAVKLFISQLSSIVKPLDGVGEGNMVGFTLRDVTFARVWLQVGLLTVDRIHCFCIREVH